MMLSLMWLALGLLLLTAGAEVLVRGGSSLALSWRISPLAVGLTVVAFGTSAPELAVSVRAALAGQGAIAASARFAIFICQTTPINAATAIRA